jgi:hypothetical protein
VQSLGALLYNGWWEICGNQGRGRGRWGWWDVNVRLLEMMRTRLLRIEERGRRWRMYRVIKGDDARLFRYIAAFSVRNLTRVKNKTVAIRCAICGGD